VRVRRSLGDERHQLTCRARRESVYPTYDVVEITPG